MTVTNWLTTEEAVKAARLSINAATLDTYPSRSSPQITAEERFQQLGLLFDRQRWLQGEPAYLRLIDPEPECSAPQVDTTQMEKELSLLTEEDSASSDDDKKVAELSDEDMEDEPQEEQTQSAPPPSEPVEAPLSFEGSKIKITLTLFPDDSHAEGRKTLVCVGNLNEPPLIDFVRLSEIGELPPLVIEMLEKLKADLPNRQVRRDIKRAEAAKKNSRKTRPQAVEQSVKVSIPPTPSSVPSTPTTKSEDKSKTSDATGFQLKLF
jgi:hypothetical protein